MANILIVYVCRQHPLRASQRDHLFSFRKYATDHRCYYLNIAFRPSPAYLHLVRFDLIVFTWSFLNSRLDKRLFPKYLRRLQPLKRMPAIKVGFPQDEFTCMDVLCDFINEFNLEFVFSVAGESEWAKIYRTVDFQRVRFFRVLTGYLDENVIRKVNELARSNGHRPVDIGYRSGTAAWWGRWNLIKQHLAERFQDEASRRGLTTDIGMGWNTFLLGDDWLRFLLRCKYIPGVEGGSSILDWDGTLSLRVRAFLESKPEADFDEIEASCFPPGKDGEIRVVALSPRHLEACVTRTCQVLVEGDYNGVLQPGKHYIELKRDFSNLDQVMNAIQRDELRKPIVERAYEDIVLSGMYTYSRFVADVIGLVLPEKRLNTRGGAWQTHFEKAVCRWARWNDCLSWVVVFTYSKARGIRDKLRQKWRKQV